MTPEELGAVTEAAPAVCITWTPDRAPGMVRLAAAPCPYHVAPSTCLVYPARPYNCRRYGCYRDDARHEPWDPAPIPPNVLADRHLRRQFARTQATAQPWALAHGWKADA